MTCACFDSRGKATIAFVPPRMNSEDYQNVLQNHLLPFLAARPDVEIKFAQDNAPIHKSHSTMQWLANHEIVLFDHPPRSPDLNPIENI